jgi:hypothetical protein
MTPHSEHSLGVSHAGFAEDDLVKQAALGLLAELGWTEQTDLRNEWQSGPSTEGRLTMKQIILQPRLEQALQVLNREVPDCRHR